jgi:hypothetical protein
MVGYHLARSHHIPMKMPELIIGYDVTGAPTEAICSSCGTRMAIVDPVFSIPTDTVRAFSIQFRSHIESAHPLSLLN